MNFPNSINVLASLLGMPLFEKVQIVHGKYRDVELARIRYLKRLVPEAKGEDMSSPERLVVQQCRCKGAHAEDIADLKQLCGSTMPRQMIQGFLNSKFCFMNFVHPKLSSCHLGLSVAGALGGFWC